MPFFCENSHAVEVVFSLVAGGEGTVVSYNPPVEVIAGIDVRLIEGYTQLQGDFTVTPGYLGVKIFNRYVPNEDMFLWTWGIKEIARDGMPPYYYKTYETVFGRTGNVVSQNDASGYQRQLTVSDSLYSIDKFEFEKVRYKNKKYDGRGSAETLNYDKHTTVWRTEYKESAFVVQDESKILYAQEYPGEIPNYRVRCITCPNELCPVKGPGNKLACLDCKKIITGIANASNVIKSLYGR